MNRPRPFIAAALIAACALFALAAPAAEARTKEQHLLDSARTAANNANKAVVAFKTSVGGDTAAAGSDKGALASQLDALDVQINIARKNSDRLSRRLAARKVVISKRATRRKTAKGKAADLALAKRLGRASKAGAQAASGLTQASTTTEQLAFDLRQAAPPDATPVGVPIGQIGANVDKALALLNKLTAPPS